MKTLLVSALMMMFSVQFALANESCETQTSTTNTATRIVREIR